MIMIIFSEKHSNYRFPLLILKGYKWKTYFLCSFFPKGYKWNIYFLCSFFPLWREAKNVWGQQGFILSALTLCCSKLKKCPISRLFLSQLFLSHLFLLFQTDRKWHPQKSCPISILNFTKLVSKGQFSTNIFQSWILISLESEK